MFMLNLPQGMAPYLHAVIGLALAVAFFSFIFLHASPGFGMRTRLREAHVQLEKISQVVAQSGISISFVQKP